MARSQYSYKAIRKHSDRMRTSSAGIFLKHQRDLHSSFLAFDKYVADLESSTQGLLKNVRMLLACKFLNHILSSLLLAERGLVVDALSCQRNALETHLFDVLVQVDRAHAETYESDEVPKPVEVRKRLEKLGFNIATFRLLYGSFSDVLHVGRPSERWTLEMETEKKGTIKFGGAFSQEDVERPLEIATMLMQAYMTPPNEIMNALNSRVS